MDVSSSGGELVSGDVENPPETGRHSQPDGELVRGDVENPLETGRHSQPDGELVRGDVGNPPETGRDSQPRLRTVESAKFKRPLLDLAEEEVRKGYLNPCVLLFNYASKGIWEKAKPMLECDEKKLLSASIAEGWTTVLHVAAGAGHAHFVKELIEMDKSHLDLQDSNGNTALSFAAIAGNLDIATSLCEVNNSLPKIRNKTGFTPLLLAALQGRANVANYLYRLTTDDNDFDEAEWNMLFLTCIDSGIYGNYLALKVLKERPEVAFARDEDDKMTGLHIMAQKTEHSGTGTKNSVAIELVHLLWEEILKGVASKSNIRDIINEPSKLLFDATKVGNFDLLAELIKAYPDLIWQFDERRLSIIHVAVLHRHSEIFNLIHEYCGSNKDIILAYIDEADGNNILHLVAKLAPPGRLELVSGAAFQMKLELLWFEAVKKTVLPSYMNKKNKNGQTPRELFTKEHAALRIDAEAWMKKTAESFMLVSTLIATGVFSIAFNVPGGISDDSGAPNYLRKPWFTVFAISDAVAMISSSTSILAFLSILISRYAERDFYKSLPSKLMFGLITLFVSITSMMVAFSSAFFVTYDHGHGLKWVPSFNSVLSILPIAIFLFFQFQLFYDIIYSACYLSSLFKPSKHVLS